MNCRLLGQHDGTCAWCHTDARWVKVWCGLWVLVEWLIPNLWWFSVLGSGKWKRQCLKEKGGSHPYHHVLKQWTYEMRIKDNEERRDDDDCLIWMLWYSFFLYKQCQTPLGTSTAYNATTMTLRLQLLWSRMLFQVGAICGYWSLITWTILPTFKASKISSQMVILALYSLR